MRVSILLNTSRPDAAIPALLAGNDRSLRRRVIQDHLLLYSYDGDKATNELTPRDYADFFYGTMRVEQRDLRVVDWSSVSDSVVGGDVLVAFKEICLGVQGDTIQWCA